jgi:acyl-CoA ligase (AMP-forming) (exosortase A-associated)
VQQVAIGLEQLGLTVDQRVAIYLPKQIETVVSFFATSLAGGIFVPINPLLKGPQAQYILNDCSVTVLITSLSRYLQMQDYFDQVKSLEYIILTDCPVEKLPHQCSNWQSFLTACDDQQAAMATPPFPVKISQDVAAILYTSGSTGNPKGVVLSHQNLVAGAKSVAEYLANAPQDKLLAVLPFSFDYGLSQLTTALLSGASLVLMEYLLPRDVIKAVAEYQITGLAAVPPLWVQLAELEWPAEARACLRYWTNSGGAMPRSTLTQLRNRLPNSTPFLMYGLTEAFRSTFLDPAEIDRRPTSMGKAIPDAEILVLNANGESCSAGEHGELVHRGPHVALGYWNLPEKTAARFKPLTKTMATGMTDEIAVWSGDTVYKDEQGFLYFVGRQDDMIKSSGYRISPTEVEDCVYQYPGVSEVAAIGVDHSALGQAVVLVIKAADPTGFDETGLLKYCQQQLPNFMQPRAVKLIPNLPRNPNGKINRPLLAREYTDLFR